MSSYLDPDAPIFTPPMKKYQNNHHSSGRTSGSSENSTPSPAKNNVKEPQCSRYSRRSVRNLQAPMLSNNNNNNNINNISPRPILGNTKLPFPRPILGRKEEFIKDVDDVDEDFIMGNNNKEFRSLNRSFQRFKLHKHQEESLTIEEQKEENLN